MKFERRKFIKRLIVAIASVEAIFLIKGGISNKARLSDDKKLIPVGKSNAYQNNHVYPFLNHHFYLKRFEDGGFLALSVKCTHLGCVINYNNATGGFNCPCHASQFDPKGQVVASPASRPLDYYPITVKNGELYVDTSIVKRRKSFLKSQLTYA